MSSSKQQKKLIAYTIHMPEDLHRKIKVAAASKDMTISDYVIYKILASGPVVVLGDLVTAPRDNEKDVLK